MEESEWISEAELARRLAKSYYLRTGIQLEPERFLAEIQRKYNQCHSAEDGKFTTSPCGVSHGGATAQMAKRPSSPTRYPARIDLRPYPVRVELPRSQPPRSTQPEIRFRHNSGLALPAAVVSKANALSDAVQATTGHQIHVTSGYRDPVRQVAAMYGNYADGSAKPYKNPNAEKEVRAAFDEGRIKGQSRAQIVNAMSTVMFNQIRRGVYISRHMRYGAIDITRPPEHVLRAIRIHPMVESVLPEDDHIHIQFHLR